MGGEEVWGWGGGGEGSETQVTLPVEELNLKLNGNF